MKGTRVYHRGATLVRRLQLDMPLAASEER